MTVQARPVQIRAGTALIDGDLAIPRPATGLVVFAHGSGSSRFSRRNRAVAQTLEEAGFATLLLDLLTRQEESIDIHTDEYRFDVDRLGQLGVVGGAKNCPDVGDARLFGLRADDVEQALIDIDGVGDAVWPHGLRDGPREEA